MAQRKIIHLDMDCFYAAVETKYRPDLKGKPIGIGGPPNSRSVLCTANYEARKYKVRAAMPSSQAVRLCPDLILIPPHFELYRKESRAVREIMLRYTSIIQPLSLDEAYLDVTEAAHCEGSATRIAQKMRAQIATELNLTASAGIAPNKFLAKIASDWNKPNGQFVIKPTDVAAFMPELPVEKIFGVGRVTAAKMHSLGLKTCGDIQKRQAAEMARWFGSRGAELWELSFGRDDRAVEARSERKSLTVEETYNKDLLTLKDCVAKVPELYQDFERRISASKYRDAIRGFVVKIKFADFKSTTHETSSRRWPEEKDFVRLLETAWLRQAEPVRLIGLGVRLNSDEAPKLLAQLAFTI